MELRQLRHFSAVASYGNFSRAAKEMNLTQPALSRQVKGLEDELGITLLNRESNTVSLTPSGEIFFEEIGEVLLRLEEAVRRVRGETRIQVLRIGYMPVLSASFLPQVLARFRASAPRVRVELFEHSEREIVAKAIAGKIDIAILTNEVGSKIPQFSWTNLNWTTPVVVMSRNHPLASCSQVRPEQIREQRVYGFCETKFPDCAPRLRSWLRPFGVKLVFSRQTADGPATLFTDLEADEALTLLPNSIENMLPRSLVTRPFSVGMAKLGVGAGLPSNRPQAVALEFMKRLKEIAVREPQDILSN